MKISVDSGKYVLAVSGGVDSMVLVDIIRKDPAISIVVAHVDHGIRKDSHLDAEFVRNYCEQHNLIFEITALHLGAEASEEKARIGRYEFLERVRKDNECDGIITAHHKNDVVETVIINLIRGTGRRGFSSLSSGQGRVRPMLGYLKEEIVAYAKEHKISWREDASNAESKYLRNHVRNNVVPRLLAASALDDFISHIDNVRGFNKSIEQELEPVTLEFFVDSEISRYFLTMAGPEAASEILAHVLRTRFGVVLDRKRMKILYHFVRTAGINSKCAVHEDIEIVAKARVIGIAKSA